MNMLYQSNGTKSYDYTQSHHLLAVTLLKSTQTQLLSVCTHSLFLCACESVCPISLGSRNLELYFANTHSMSLPVPGDVETVGVYMYLISFFCTMDLIYKSIFSTSIRPKLSLIKSHVFWWNGTSSKGMSSSLPSHQHFQRSMFIQG